MENKKKGGDVGKISLGKAAHHIGEEMKVVLEGEESIEMVKDSIGQHEIDQEKTQIEKAVMTNRRFFKMQEREKSFHGFKEKKNPKIDFRNWVFCFEFKCRNLFQLL